MKVLKKLSIMLLTLMICFSIVPSDVSAESYAAAGKSYSMSLTSNNSTATYKIKLKRAQKIVFTLTTRGSKCHYEYFKIYDSSGNQIRLEYIQQNNEVGKKTTVYTDYLLRGDYTLVFTSVGNQGKLTWSYNVKNISKITQRKHNLYSRAPTCGFRKYYFDHFGSGNAKNIVKFNVPANGTYELRVTSTVKGSMEYTIYNNSIDQVYKNGYIAVNSDTGKVNDKKNISLKKGTYYVVFKTWRTSNCGVYKWMMRRIY